MSRPPDYLCVVSADPRTAIGPNVVTLTFVGPQFDHLGRRTGPTRYGVEVLTITVVRLMSKFSGTDKVVGPILRHSG